MITVSISTFDWGALRRLHRMPKSDALVILIVVAVVVATNNLAYGVILGLALTAIFFSLHMSSLKVEEIRDGKTLIYIVKGQLFFASTEAFTEALNFHNDAKTIILDLGQARLWDESAAAAIRGHSCILKTTATMYSHAALIRAAVGWRDILTERMRFERVTVAMFFGK